MTATPRFWRRLSTLLLTLWLLVIVASFVHRQLRRRPAVAPVELGAASTSQDAPVRVQKGFVWNDVLGVEPNLRVAAQETVEYASGWYELRDVTVSTFKNGTVAYQVNAETARINTGEKQGLLEGDVQLALDEGVALRTDAVAWRGEAQVLESRGAATFAGPGWGGLAGRLVIGLQGDEIELREGVSVSWRRGPADAEPLVVLAPRMVYQRQRGVLTCPDGVTFLRGALRIAAPRATVRLDAEAGDVGGVELGAPVRMAGPVASGGWLEGEAGDTSLDALEGGRIRLTAGPVPGTGWVAVRWAGPDGVVRQLTTWRLVGEGSRERWEWMEGQERVCGREVSAGAVTRDMEADALLVEFAGGQARTAQATGAVRVNLGNAWAEGGSLTASLGGGGFTLLPAPGSWVRSGSGSLHAECQRVESTADGAVLASGQVHGFLDEQPTGEAGVTRFAASSARLEGERVLLQEDARLWQQDRLVRADTLDYDRVSDRVVARGNVLTTAVSVDEDGERGTLRIASRSLAYDRRAGTAQYSGDVRLEDARVSAECQEMAVTFGSAGGVVYATLGGGVTMREVGSARTITGQGARLMAAVDTVQIWGSPVVIKEPGGNTVSGDMVTWERASGSVLVQGSKDVPSETVYVRGPDGTLTARPTPRPGEGSPP